MQINQPFVRFSQVLTKEINKKVLKTLVCINCFLVSANHSLVSINWLLTESKLHWNQPRNKLSWTKLNRELQTFSRKWDTGKFKYPKNQNFGKWKTLLEISPFYTCVPKITIIWYKVPRYMVRQKILSFQANFCPFTHPHPTPPPLPPLMISKKKFLNKNE